MRHLIQKYLSKNILFKVINDYTLLLPTSLVQVFSIQLRTCLTIVLFTLIQMENLYLFIRLHTHLLTSQKQFTFYKSRSILNPVFILETKRRTILVTNVELNFR